MTIQISMCEEVLSVSVILIGPTPVVATPLEACAAGAKGKAPHSATLRHLTGRQKCVAKTLS